MHCMWYEPISNSTANKLAVERAQAFFLHWLISLSYNELACFLLLQYMQARVYINPLVYVSLWISSIMQVLGPNHIWKISWRNEKSSGIYSTRIFKKWHEQIEEGTGFYRYESLHQLLRSRLHLVCVWTWNRKHEDRRFLSINSRKRWSSHRQTCMYPLKSQAMRLFRISSFLNKFMKFLCHSRVKWIGYMFIHKEWKRWLPM